MRLDMISIILKLTPITNIINIHFSEQSVISNDELIFLISGVGEVSRLNDTVITAIYKK